MNPLDAVALRMEMARMAMTRRQLACELQVRPSTLSSWLNGASPAPKDLAARIEAAMRLRPGTLRRSSNDVTKSQGRNETE